MKRWGVIVVCLYAFIMAVLAGPLEYVLVWLQKNSDVLSGMLGIYTSMELWILLVVALIAQAALLSVPVELKAGRPVTKRSIIPVVVSTALAITLLAVGIIGSVVEALREDLAAGFLYYGWIVLGVLLVIWAIWAIIFFRWSKAGPKTFVERQCQLLFKGSILELLVAVPCHIIVRQRNDCCGGMLTGAGIALGIAVMLFSFGPGVFYLFVSRIERTKGYRKKV